MSEDNKETETFILRKEEDEIRLFRLYQDYGELRDEIYERCYSDLKRKWNVIKIIHNSELTKLTIGSLVGIALSFLIFDGFSSGVAVTIVIIISGYCFYNLKQPNPLDINYTLPDDLDKKWKELE